MNLLELDVACRVSRWVGFNELVSRFDVRGVRMNIDDLTAAELVKGLEERLEERIPKVETLVVRKHDHSSGTQIVDSIASLRDGFVSVWKRNDRVKTESAGV